MPSKKAQKPAMPLSAAGLAPLLLHLAETEHLLPPHFAEQAATHRAALQAAVAKLTAARQGRPKAAYTICWPGKAAQLVYGGAALGKALGRSPAYVAKALSLGGGTAWFPGTNPKTGNPEKIKICKS